MNIAIIGATGRAGALITEEAIRREHQVTAIIRDRTKLNRDIPFLEKDVFDLTHSDVFPYDVLVYALATWGEHLHLREPLMRHFVGLLREDQRVLFVGGAGSLVANSGVKLKDSADFPERIQQIADMGQVELDIVRESSLTRWTYVSPAERFLYEAPALGQYFFSDDRLPVNDGGDSEISYRDYATAFVDEIELGRYIGQQCSIGSEVSYS
ncbi:NAD(P)H-binding protein [Dolosigranulum savutiense]|uniref:NAD(P)H-binding protein n=1 Tax=Dolosigranulum savutiense TaxID=3110288 RepID=A0AB74TZ84_9LACT